MLPLSAVDKAVPVSSASSLTVESRFPGHGLDHCGDLGGRRAC